LKNEVAFIQDKLLACDKPILMHFLLVSGLLGDC